MIVVVEGPSAAGKTTWCQRHFPDQTVWEAPVTQDAPNRNADPRGAAEFWASANAKRWQAALAIERTHGLVVCDSDPLQLHYIWSLWQHNHASPDSWQHELEIHRKLFTQEELGLADLYLVSLPGYETLRLRKSDDPTRTRRSFELHASLSPRLRQWYTAVENLDRAVVVDNQGLMDVGVSMGRPVAASRNVRWRITKSEI